MEISDLFPVRPGYVHYSEIRNRVIGFNSHSTQENQNTQDKEIKQDKNTINTTAFCPHCGAKVRAGVVLIAE